MIVVVNFSGLLLSPFKFSHAFLLRWGDGGTWLLVIYMCVTICQVLIMSRWGEGGTWLLVIYVCDNMSSFNVFEMGRGRYTLTSYIWC